MTKINPKTTFKAIGLWGKKHAPEIGAGLGITGMLTTTVLAVKATPKALVLIEEEKRRQNRYLLEEAKVNGYDTCNRIEKLRPVEVVKVTWKCYIPAAITGTLSILCLIGASTASARRNAALAAAYTISESALKDYKNKVVEVVGEGKEREVRDAIAKDKIAKDPVENKEIIVTGKGETRCYDALSGRYFDSDINWLNKAANELNRRMINQTYASLNDFYYEIGLPDLSENEIGDLIGWRVDQGLIELDFSAQLATDGVPCLVMHFNIMPKYDFDKWL